MFMSRVYPNFLFVRFCYSKQSHQHVGVGSALQPPASSHFTPFPSLLTKPSSSSPNHTSTMAWALLFGGVLLLCLAPPFTSTPRFTYIAGATIFFLANNMLECAILNK
mmetsp:Transcript_26305/g.60787  ORF Transcript_26305/g.60787 Transcript_26305/m.60787 type:complete len:108 (+) Transcript_26305:123-446(+)